MTSSWKRDESSKTYTTQTITWLRLRDMEVIMCSESALWPTSVYIDMVLTAASGSRCVHQPRPHPWSIFFETLQGRHNEGDGVWNHRRCDCLPNRLFRRRSKKASKPLVTDLWEGNSLVTVHSQVTRSVTREMFQFDYIIITMFLHLD